jgi:hypothetical protein
MKNRFLLSLLFLFLLSIPVQADMISFEGDVHMRASREVSSECVRIIHSGLAITVVNRDEEWCEVEFDGSKGYVRTIYIGPGEGRKVGDGGENIEGTTSETPTPTPTDNSATAPPSTPTAAPPEPVTPGGSSLDNLSTNLSTTPVGGNGSGLPVDEKDLPFKLSEVKWLHTNVSKWPVTAKLKSVKLSKDSITLDYDKSNVWKPTQAVGVTVVANPWIFVKQGDTWYAATFEWMRPGQITKGLKAVKGDHIKMSPLQNFTPKTGETYYFMVSGLARFKERSNEERSNLVKIIWP